MTRRLWYALAAAAALHVGAACAGDSSGVTPDPVAGIEKAAVLEALDCGLSGDPLYGSLTRFVLPFVDRASYVVSPGGDTTRVVGVQVHIDAVVDSVPVLTQLTAVLSWTGFDSAAATVDTTVFIVGGGAAVPLTDSLRVSWSPVPPGSGSATSIHMTGPNSCVTWLSRSGAMNVTDVSFGGGSTQGADGVVLTVARGSLTGDYDFLAKQVPDSATTITTALLLSAVQAMRIDLGGTITNP